jgi:hypothetical protein
MDSGGDEAVGCSGPILLRRLKWRRRRAAGEGETSPLLHNLVEQNFLCLKLVTACFKIAIETEKWAKQAEWGGAGPDPTRRN